VLIEAGEESGSPDLPFYVDFLAKQIGTPSLIVCLDSGCGNYEQLWGTTSLRGLVDGELSVDVLRAGVHSGDASGIVPSSFRILRTILSRLEKPETGQIIPKNFHAAVPRDRLAQAKITAKVLGDNVWRKFPLLHGVKTMHSDNVEMILNRTWRPVLAIVGADGLPAIANAGNVLRPRTSVKVSLRLPPTKNARDAAKELKALFEKDPPSGAKVTFTPGTPGTGWNAPAMSKWLDDAVARASQTYYGKPAVYMGEGGSIPFMGMLGAKFPKAQFLITGVLGPRSNAHGPNEFLHIGYAKKLTACVASILSDHAAAGFG
jgi:acetylornithine deacetylase/succinyl-diaminopimelate desuccinylase-like protein